MKKSKIIISYTLLLLSGIIMGLLLYIKNNYSNCSFEQLMYSLIYANGTSINAIFEGIIYCTIFTVIFIIIILLPFHFEFKTVNYINIIIKNKEYKFQIFPLKSQYKYRYFTLIFIVSVVVFLNKIGAFNYISMQLNKSNIFEEYYVDPFDAEITFDDNKKNLIYIYVESLETTNASKLNGGVNEVSYIPNLESLALNNLNFSNTNTLGGAYQISSTGWTIASLVAQTSGIPLKLSIDGNSYANYSSFLPGAYSLGEVLEENGYSNYLMIGSEASFAGRKDYFEIHGNYTIYDYYWAAEEKFIDEDYYEWWGYEDSKLFEFAKNKLLEIANKDEPFNFSLLTADTHFPDGYIDKNCDDNIFDNHYASSFYCSDSMIYEFVDWITKQDFYDDTVIVIVGDHLIMQSDFYDNIDNNYQRTIYNVIINSNIISDYTKN